MIIAILASDLQKEEIDASPFFRKHELQFSENSSLWKHHRADVFMDLTFEPKKRKIKSLARLLPRTVLVHAVTHTLDALHPGFIRVNAWPGFLKGNCLEAAANPDMQEKACRLFGNDLVFVHDSPGLVSARILAMIINEAHFTWEAGTGQKEAIDMAMKLGTGYPLGPFEWAEKIGVKQVVQLLEMLKDPLYSPAGSLKHKQKSKG